MLNSRMDNNDSISVVLVTNVGQGYGRAVALSYGKAGYDVVCADRDVDMASRTAAEIEEAGGQAIPIQADISSLSDVKNAFDKVYEIFGDLSGVVHVASIYSQTRFRDLSDGEFDELVDEILRTTFLTLKTAARRLENGWMVLITPPKTAVEPHMVALRGAMTRMASGFEARYDNLRVNVIVPSRQASDPTHDAALVDAVNFFGSEAARGISGHRFYVELPPPPKVIESLLPEVRAALDENMGQEELEANHYDDGFEDGSNEYFTEDLDETLEDDDTELDSLQMWEV